MQDWKSWSYWFESNLKHLAYVIQKLTTIFVNKGLIFIMKNLNFVQSPKIIFFLKQCFLFNFFIHLKSNSFFNKVRSVDFLSYDNPNLNKIVTVTVMSTSKSNKRLILFSTTDMKYNSNSNLKKNTKTLEKLFFNFWWMEREVSELYGIYFYYKQDNRNLLTEYFNTLKPMLRKFPSVGLFEIFYDSYKKTTIHNYISLQI